MNRLKSTLTILAAAATMASAATPLRAQNHARVSPHETVSADLGGGRVMVVYGRPYTKSPKDGTPRKIWGGLVPFGKVWRMGADEATLFVTESSLTVGEATVPAGAYTLFLLPKEDGTAQLIFNKEIGQWGETYDEKQDAFRVDLKKATLDKPVDQFTVAITKGAAGGGELTMSWENTGYSAPLAIKK